MARDTTLKENDEVVALAEEIKSQSLTEKAKLELEKAKPEDNLDTIMYVYNHNLKQGKQWQDSCTRQSISLLICHLDWAICLLMNKRPP